MKKGVFAVLLLFFVLSSIVYAKDVFFAASTPSLLHFAMGKYYFENQDYQSAIAYFEKSVDEDNGFEEAYHNLGVSYYQIGNFENAVSNFETAVSLNPQYSRAFYSMGLLYFENGDYDKSIIALENAALLDSSNANINFDLGVALVEMFREKENYSSITTDDLNDLKIALSYYEKTLAIDGSFPNAESNAEIVREVLAYYRNFNI